MQSRTDHLILQRAFRLLAPYIAVLLFWCILSNAWLAILAYHAQILFWARSHVPKELPKKGSGSLWFAAPALLAGPLLYVLLPHITHVDLCAWLEQHHVSRLSLMIMIPYFGLLHPVLEQIHWAPLRKETSLAHILFAGYHMLVLYSLLTVPWLLLCFVVLTTASIIWKQTTQRSGSLLAPILSHILADFGIVLAAWLTASLPR